MNLDYTYIILFGHPVFEPLTIATNLILFFFALYFFSRLSGSTKSYGRDMGWFILLLGLSSVFGAVAHGVHYQLGKFFFDAMFFLLNLSGLISIFFCFRAPLQYTGSSPANQRSLLILVIVWLSVLMVFCVIWENFLLIKIHAGLVLLYSLAAHLWATRNKPEAGNRVVVAGILISFLPILVHTFHISIHEWFNYKDLAHVIMIISLYVIGTGAWKNTQEMTGAKEIVSG
jgi:hypothetical protein